MDKQNTKWWLAMIGSGALLAAGCQCPIQRIQNSPPVAVNDTPLIIDTAMQIRDWDQSVAWYGNGDTPAHPIGFLYESRPGLKNEYYYAGIETPLFIGQGVASPIVFLFNWPWSHEMYSGVTVPPSFTAMPVLPPSTEVPAEAAPVPMESTPATQPS